MRKLYGPAFLVFVIFLIAYYPSTAADSASAIGRFLGRLANGAGQMLGQLVS